ncbi:alpha-L-arabinofuranosidase C-terminal domain-containing protein [Pseudarthrobacter oxydans]|uniref:alpha-L-arabinofuranosidase C-terminal domain-containing protein n=1 Tax=Pseudarthrobacter oxydans TaxID=1671 RepID=UPI0037FEC5DD
MTGPREVRIDVGTKTPATEIGGDLVGIFFEDLSSAADGGLYAELVRNRAFEFTSLDQPGWGPLTGWEVRSHGGAKVTVSTTDPAFSVNPTHLEVSLPDTPGSSLALVNTGYDGIVIRKGAEYRLNVHLRRLNGSSSTVRVALVDPAGTELATGALWSLTEEWVSYPLVLRAAASAVKASLVLEFSEPGGIAVDHVSLFPVDTFRRQENGVRADLAETLLDLKPRFVRFPGGCIAHGLGLENMYRWKETLGPVEERRQNFNLWGYHQSMGLGYLEYFILCEQLGAKPLPVVAAGVCCQNLPGGPVPIPEEEMANYIQEVLDLVEWANGPVNTYWGARRGAAGHPEPFGLEYLAIGNEDHQNDTFRDRFTRIHDAVRAVHPEITVIGTVGPSPFGRDFDEGWAFARKRQVPMVDEHSYKSPRWFFENLTRFDSYDRSGPAVYLGEWGSKGNRMLNALAEAAYLGALERNGDVVRLASWAPLFAKLGQVHWDPDLIYFDNERVLPSLNYYVQRMHSTAAGDQALSVRTDGAPTFERPETAFAGVSITAAGGTVDLTGVRFDDATGAEATYRDESDDAAAPTELILPITTTAEDYSLYVRATLIRGSDGFTIGFGGVGTPEHFAWNFGTWRNRHVTLYRRTDGYLDEIADPVPFSVEPGRLHDIEIQVTGRGRRITCLLDGEVISEYVATDAPEQRFSATAVRDSATGATVVKIVNATDSPVTARIFISDAPLEGFVTREQISGDPDAGAPCEPAPFTPTTDEIMLAGGLVEIPEWSFTTLKRQSSTTTASPDQG